MTTTYVRIGAGRVVHHLAEYRTAADSTAQCGKHGKVTIIPLADEPLRRPQCDRCNHITRIA